VLSTVKNMIKEHMTRGKKNSQRRDGNGKLLIEKVSNEDLFEKKEAWPLINSVNTRITDTFCENGQRT